MNTETSASNTLKASTTNDMGDGEMKTSKYDSANLLNGSTPGAAQSETTIGRRKPCLRQAHTTKLLLALAGVLTLLLSPLGNAQPAQQQNAAALDELLGLVEEQLPAEANDHVDFNDRVVPPVDPRADPCAFLPHPPGKAKGIEKQCHRTTSSSGIARSDFNGDGFADLAIGVPDKNTPNEAENAGAVIVIYGSADGLTATNPAVPASQFWSQNSPGVPGASEAGDRFGSALAAGDFNGDGFSDLAIGIPGEDITVSGLFGPTTFEDVGGVVIIYGSSVGLTTGNSSLPPARFLDFTDGGRSDKFQNYVQLGSSLTWGDFNGDGDGDLAIGAPGFSTFPITGDAAGAVWVLYGSGNNGLSTQGNSFWTRGDTGLGSSSRFDLFGNALTAGDFNGDGNSDLVIGVPGKDTPTGLFTSIPDTGEIIVLFGSTDNGITSAGAQQRDFDIGISPFSFLEEGQFFGNALAAGDFNGDGRSDLAVGVPFRTVNSRADAGAVYIIIGTNTGLSNFRFGGNQIWNQDAIRQLNSSFTSTSETGDRFGSALAAGDFNNDGRADLAIGVPFESVASGTTTVRGAGEVDVIYGSALGLSPTNRTPQRFHQATTGIVDNPETDDHFGARLSAWNFGRNETIIGPPPLQLRITVRPADLAIGVPQESVGSASFAGAVHVLYGSFVNQGLTTTGAQFWTQNSPGVPGTSQAFESFGFSLY